MTDVKDNEELNVGIANEVTGDLIDQGTAILHNRLSALNTRIPSFKLAGRDIQLAILMGIREKDIDDFVKVATSYDTAFTGANQRRLREAMVEFGIELEDSWPFTPMR